MFVKLNIEGPVLPIITPFKKNQAIDYKSLRKMLDYYYKRGARNFYLMVFNSRIGLLTEKEIFQLNKFVIQHVKKYFKDSIIIACEKFDGSTTHTIKFCNQIEKFRPDAISLIFGEKFNSEDQVFSHFHKIAKGTNSKLLLHLQDMTNGMSNNPPMQCYSENLTNKICKIKSFVSIKDDAKNDRFTNRILKKSGKNISIIKSGGGMGTFAKIKDKGCKSWLSGIEIVDPMIGVDFYKALKSDDKKFCKFIIEDIEKPYFKIVSKFGWHLVSKSSLSFVKIMESNDRLPLKKLGYKQEKEIFDFLKKAKKLCKNKYNKNYFLNVK